MAVAATYRISMDNQRKGIIITTIAGKRKKDRLITNKDIRKNIITRQKITHSVQNHAQPRSLALHFTAPARRAMPDLKSSSDTCGGIGISVGGVSVSAMLSSNLQPAGRSFVHVAPGGLRCIRVGAIEPCVARRGQRKFLKVWQRNLHQGTLRDGSRVGPLSGITASRPSGRPRARAQAPRASSPAPRAGLGAN